MAKLKRSTIESDRPVKVTHELPASVHRDLDTYAEMKSWRERAVRRSVIRQACSSRASTSQGRWWVAFGE